MNKALKQKGLGLVELMIAITLGLFLVGGAIQVFMTSQTTHRTVGSVSDIQGSARYSMYLLDKDIRMAGYTGCVTRGGSQEVTNMLDSSDTLYDFSSGGLLGENNITGLPASLTTALATDPPPLVGTDVLIVRSPIGSPTNLSTNNNSAVIFTDVITNETGACDDETNRVNGICKGDLLMVADCAKARIFQATNTTVTHGGSQFNIVHASSGTPGNSQSSWGGNNAPENEKFGSDSEIFRISTVVYYIGDDANSDVPVLYRKEGNASATVIADGVQDMQLEYGRDNNGDFEVDEYVTANSVTDWTAILAVRIRLHLVSKDDNVLNDSQTYTFNGAEQTATDRRMHYALTSTIALRNRVP